MAITKFHYSQCRLAASDDDGRSPPTAADQQTPVQTRTQHRVPMAETRIHFSFSVDTVLNILGAAMILISVVVASVLGRTGVTFEAEC